MKWSEWDGMVRELLEQRADLAIADLTITFDREQVNYGCRLAEVIHQIGLLFVFPGFRSRLWILRCHSWIWAYRYCIGSRWSSRPIYSRSCHRCRWTCGSTWRPPIWGCPCCCSSSLGMFFPAAFRWLSTGVWSPQLFPNYITHNFF